MSDRDEDGKRFREYCCRTDENIHPERRGWDTETFTVIRHHHDTIRADLGDNHEPGQDKQQTRRENIRN